MVPTELSPNGPIPPEEIRADPSFQLLLRGQLERETDLLGQRTAWVMASQAFLFSAYAMAVNGHIDGSSPDGGRHVALLMSILPWISLLSLILFMVTIVGGLFALVRLRQFLLTSADPRVRGLDPGALARGAGLTGPVLVPVVFLVAWVVLLVER